MNADHFSCEHQGRAISQAASSYVVREEVDFQFPSDPRNSAASDAELKTYQEEIGKTMEGELRCKLTESAYGFITGVYFQKIEEKEFFVLSKASKDGLEQYCFVTEIAGATCVIPFQTAEDKEHLQQVLSIQDYKQYHKAIQRLTVHEERSFQLYIKSGQTITPVTMNIEVVPVGLNQQERRFQMPA